MQTAWRPRARQLELADSYILGQHPSGRENPDPLESRMERVIEGIKPGRKPYIFLLNDVKPLKLPSISINNVSVGRMAADHLHLRGYPHFAFFGYSDPPWSFLRRQGFLQRLMELGCSCRVHEFPLGHLFLEPSRLQATLRHSIRPVRYFVAALRNFRGHRPYRRTARPGGALLWHSGAGSAGNPRRGQRGAPSRDGGNADQQFRSPYSGTRLSSGRDN